VIPILMPLGGGHALGLYPHAPRGRRALHRAGRRPFWHHGAHQADVERNFRRIETVGIRMKRLSMMG
jgi:hypothetical protein